MRKKIFANVCIGLMATMLLSGCGSYHEPTTIPDAGDRSAEKKLRLSCVQGKQIQNSTLCQEYYMNLRILSVKNPMDGYMWKFIRPGSLGMLELSFKLCRWEHWIL